MKKDLCFRCGKSINYDDGLYLITRLDPHSGVERRITDEEAKDMPKNVREAGRFGYRIGRLCPDCAQKET